MKKILLITAVFSLLASHFSLLQAQQPDAIYKLLRYEWTVNADGTTDYHYRHEVQILRNRALVAYADKRVRHSEVVTLQERFDDLLERYGVSPEHVARISGYLEHTRAVERAIFERIGEF